MTIPSILLGILISTLYGVLFHLWRGGSFFRLVFYILLSWAGFWAGQAVASYFGWAFDSLGTLHLGTASLGSLIFLFVGYWMSLVEVQLE